VIGAGVVVAVASVVGEAASVAVAPNSEVGLAVVRGNGVGDSPDLDPSEAKTVCVAMVLKIDDSASGVGVASDALVAERVQAPSTRAAIAKTRSLFVGTIRVRDTSTRKMERQARSGSRCPLSQD
jgi:hypothetical protein